MNLNEIAHDMRETARKREENIDIENALERCLYKNQRRTMRQGELK